MREYLIAIALAGSLGLARLEAQSGINRYVPASPLPAGYISDGGPVLSPADLADLNNRIEAHQAGGRGDIGVAVLRDLGDYTASEVGLSIYRSWKIGSVDSLGSDRRDLGVLLLIVPKELSPSGTGDCYITTGLGAEGFITDATAGRICREVIVPFLVKRDHAGAIRAGIDAIAAELTGVSAVEGTKAPAVQGDGGSSDGGGGGVPGGLIALLGVAGAGTGGAVVYRKRKRKKPRLCPNGHGAMTLLDEKADDAALERGQLREEELKSVDYDVWQCESCSERLVLRYKRWFTSYSQCPQCKFFTVKSKTRTLIPATTSSGGLAETTRTCHNCGFGDTRQVATPRLSSSSSSSGGSSSGGGRSFGGSGRSAGGGGGSRY